MVSPAPFLLWVIVFHSYLPGYVLRECAGEELGLDTSRPPRGGYGDVGGHGNVALLLLEAVCDDEEGPDEHYGPLRVPDVPSVDYHQLIYDLLHGIVQTVLCREREREGRG